MKGDKMPILYESYTFQNTNLYPQGWTRTFLLALGAGAGVLVTAGVIHAFKRGSPEKQPKGAVRTLLLACGAGAGVLGTASLIHFYKQSQVSITEV